MIALVLQTIKFTFCSWEELRHILAVCFIKSYTVKAEPVLEHNHIL